MQRLHTTAFFATAAATLLAAASWLGPGPGDSDAGESAAPRAAHARAPDSGDLDCRLAVAPGGAMQVRLGRDHGPALARGTRVAWSTLGDPRPAGDVLALPHDLAAGDTLVLDRDLAHHAAGCRARVWQAPGA
jgi:hypothetical protein